MQALWHPDEPYPVDGPELDAVPEVARYPGPRPYLTIGCLRSVTTRPSAPY
ncbi:hypothetical protein HMPREF9599_02531 [Cutibacterium acnes HL050PA2]|nr:hypothetical protein [Cutibacterium acnes]EFT76243.1 hypothetical protein HMPREF9599_02531 [Cutibacterium acnes HL050PA2]